MATLMNFGIESNYARKCEAIYAKNLSKRDETIQIAKLIIERAQAYNDEDMFNSAKKQVIEMLNGLTTHHALPSPKLAELSSFLDELSPKEPVVDVVPAEAEKEATLTEEISRLRAELNPSNHIPYLSEIDQLKLENESLKRHLANNGAKPVHGRQPLDPKQQHLETSINDVLQPDVVSATVAALAPMLAELVNNAVQTQMAVLTLAQAESEVEVELKEALDRLDQVELTAKEVTPVEKPKPKPVHQKPVPTPDDLEPEQPKARGK